MNNAVNAILAGLNSPAVSAKVTELEERKKLLLIKKTELSSRAPELTEEMFVAAVKCLVDEPSEALLTTIVKRIELNGDYITVYFRLFDVDGESPEKISAKIRRLTKGDKCSPKVSSSPPQETLYEHGYVIINIPIFCKSR